MSLEEFTSASFNRFLGEKKLMGSRCPKCQTLYLPPRPLCPQCHSPNMEWAELKGRGKLAAFTTIHVCPTFMVEQGWGRDNPYCTGIVELEEGPKISALILGVDAKNPTGIRVGTPLRVKFLEWGEAENKRTVLGFTA